MSTAPEQAEFIRARVHLNRAFTPGAPVTHRDSLAGRSSEVRRIMEAVTSIGRHVIIFGERGVGKTSLAGLVHEFWEDFFKDLGLIVPRVNCEPLADFATIWSHVADEIEAQCTKKGITIPDGETRALLDQLKNGDASSHVVRRLCESWGDVILIIIIDELDRIQDGDAVEAFAETIKNLSDHSVEDTLILVGVADTIDDLIEDHQSINRALVQVHLGRLEKDDIIQLLRSRIEGVGMSIEERAAEYIAKVSQGLPYYGHLIGLTSGLAALEHQRMSIEFSDVLDGLDTAIESSVEVVQSAYYNATISSRSEIYPAILLACALAETDDRGYFSPVDIRGPLSKIMGERYEISRYLRHLAEFCGGSRGKILEKRGVDRKPRYRFSDPLMKPFVILHSIQSGMLKPDEW